MNKIQFILLVSIDKDTTVTRRYQNFFRIEDMAKAIMTYYEDYLEETRMGDGAGSMEYETNDMFKFLLDSIGELVCLSLTDETQDIWEPKPKDWILEKVYHYIRSISTEKQNNDEVEMNGIETADPSQNPNGAQHSLPAWDGFR